MNHAHAPRHGRRRASHPALWLAAVLVALAIASLVAIVLFLHHLAQLALELAQLAWLV